MQRDAGVQGPSNFRDLGGYVGADGRRVRWRTVFRSDALRLSEADVAVLRDDIGLRTVVDLRTTMEFGRHGEAGANPTHAARQAAVGARRLHLPMIDETRVARQAADIRPPAARGYFKMLDRGAPVVVEVLRLVADPANRPLVFHCAAGKDRTGIVAATLLGLLGVDDATIVADYALSQAAMARALERIRARPDAERILANRPLAGFEAPTGAVEGFVAAVREEHGGWGGVAERLGLSTAEVDRLRAELLEA